MTAENVNDGAAPTDETTTYAYTDPYNGSLQTSETDPGQNATLTTYDPLGRTLSTTDQRGVVHEYVYDPAGRVTLDMATSLGTDTAPAAGAIRSIGTTYDGMGRVQIVTSYALASGPGSTIVNQVEDAYDGWGNLTKEWQAPGGAVDTSGPATVEYDYADGATGTVAAYLRLGDVVYPNARKIDYNYAAGVDYIMSRLSFISEQDGTVDAAYQYLGLDTIAVEDYPQAGIELAYTFDRFGRVEYQAWEPDSGSGSILDQIAYVRDRDGNVTSALEETAGNAPQSPGMDSVWTQYSFDGLGRVSSYTQQLYAATGETSTSGSWLYDSLGNNIQQSTGGSYNADNEETAIKGSSVVPGYDLAGNMQTLSNGDTAVYDAWGRLVEVDGTSGIVEQCQYDGTGRRVQISTKFTGATAGTVETDYYSGQQVIESDTALTGGATTRYQYVWSARYIDAPVCRDTLNGDGTVNLNDRMFYLGDANYNVTEVVQYNAGSGTWQVAERYSYGPYGKVTVYDTSWNPIAGNQSQAGIDNTIFYAGETFDTSTGLYYDRARYYDPQLGRFISQDPMGYAAGMNLYAYCGDNPTDATDPSGMVGVFFDGAGQVRGDETIMQDLYEEYDGSAAIFYTHILPNNIWANIHGAQDIVAEEVGKKKGCEPVDLFGWSRGAVAALTLAEILKDDGVTYKGRVYKPVKVRFMGLIDPVATGGYQMVGTNSTVIPSNVRVAYIAYAGLQTRLGWWIFQATHPVPEDFTSTFLQVQTFNYSHEKIGLSMASDVEAALKAHAVFAGVPFA